MKKLHRPGYFDLGKWTWPVAIIALAWIAVAMLILTIPESQRVNALYAFGNVLVGGAWYVFVLRGRLKRGEAGSSEPLPAAPTESFGSPVSTSDRE
jgi:hypothetical protein